MRVIRTEMYFDPAALNRQFMLTDGPAHPAVSFAFLKESGADRDPMPSRALSFLIDVNPDNDGMIDAVLDSALTGAPYNVGLVPTNRSITAYIREQEIVVERSPPMGVPFSTLLRGASAASIGTAVGWGALNGQPLLFLTVPAGILVVGSAIAISKGLEKGLANWAGQIFKKKSSRSRTPTRGSGNTP